MKTRGGAIRFVLRVFLWASLGCLVALLVAGIAIWWKAHMSDYVLPSAEANRAGKLLIGAVYRLERDYFTTSWPARRSSVIPETFLHTPNAFSGTRYWPPSVEAYRRAPGAYSYVSGVLPAGTTLKYLYMGMEYDWYGGTFRHVSVFATTSGESPTRRLSAEYFETRDFTVLRAPDGYQPLKASLRENNEIEPAHPGEPLQSSGR